MRHSRIGLPDNTKKVAINLLQTALVDTLDLRLAVKQAHWTVKGSDFQQLHELFDSFVAPLDEEIDTIAERISILGGVPDGRAATVGTESRLEAYPLDGVSGGAHLAWLADRFAALGNHIRTAIDAADDVGDADTADIFTGTSRFLDKSLWFIEAHITTEQS